MNNFFTVIVPNLNHGEYLSNCLNSILKQNYKKFEIIILDGGSIDHSLKIIKNFAKKNKSITYWHSKKDDGQANAINLGIKLAKGNWITWQNSDDQFSSNNALNLMNKYINSNYLITPFLSILWLGPAMTATISFTSISLKM